MPICPHGGEWNGETLDGTVDTNGFVTLTIEDILRAAYPGQDYQSVFDSFLVAPSRPSEVFSVDELCDSVPVIPSGDFSSLFENPGAYWDTLSGLAKYKLFEQLCNCKPNPDNACLPSAYFSTSTNGWHFCTIFDNGEYSPGAYVDGIYRPWYQPIFVFDETAIFEVETRPGDPSIPDSVEIVVRRNGNIVWLDSSKPDSEVPGQWTHPVSVLRCFRDSGFPYPPPIYEYSIMTQGDVEPTCEDGDLECVKIIYLPGIKGDKGDPGDDATVETESINVKVPDCENGVGTLIDVAVDVIKPTTGSTALLWQLLFETLGNLAKERICGMPTFKEEVLIAANNEQGGFWQLPQGTKYVSIVSVPFVDGIGKRFGYDTQSSVDDIYEISRLYFGFGEARFQEILLTRLDHLIEVPEISNRVELITNSGWKCTIKALVFE